MLLQLFYLRLQVLEVDVRQALDVRAFLDVDDVVTNDLAPFKIVAHRNLVFVQRVFADAEQSW